jgi:aspartokinase
VLANLPAWGLVPQVSYTRGMSIISLICNVQRTSEILERVFRVLGAQDVNVKMMSQVHWLKVSSHTRTAIRFCSGCCVLGVTLKHVLQ